MITYRSRWLQYAEVWLDEPDPGADIDVLYRFRAPAPVDGAQNEAFHTLLIDLTRDEQELLAGYHRSARSDIKRAESGGDFRCEVIGNPGSREFGAFVAFYDEFAHGKGLPPLSAGRLELHRSNGTLTLSRVASQGEVLVWHASIRFATTATLNSSASLYRGKEAEFRSMVGRANRLLHHRDMLYFKANGCSAYDFGGWYDGSSDEEKLGINQFKEKFGGVKNLSYNVVQYRTRRAKLLKAIRKALKPPVP
jgi:FemAB family